MTNRLLVTDIAGNAKENVASFTVTVPYSVIDSVCNGACDSS